MLEKKRVNTGALLSLFGAVAALALVILLENTIGPTGQLFTVLKKGAVYALVAPGMEPIPPNTAATKAFRPGMAPEVGVM